MKILKRVFLVLGIILVLLIGTLAAIPYFFKDDILALAKEEINKTVNAKVDFQDVELSVFRNFPDFTFRLLDFNVEGIDRFEGIKLASGDYLDFTLDLFSVVQSGKPIQIESVHLQKPEVNVLVLEDGLANYDIAKPTDERLEETAEQELSEFEIKLKSYSLADGNIVYDDKSAGIYLAIKDLDHEGNGNFTSQVYDLDTETTIQSITVRQGGISYLKNAQAALDAIFNIDQGQQKYTFKENNLHVNDLDLHADGYVQLAGEDINMEIDVNTPNNQFKNVLSMVPSAFIKGYEQVKADGTFALDGKVNGTYNAAKNKLPAFNINIQVNNGDVQYPDLPLGISGINTKASVNSPSSNFDKIVVDVPQFNMKIGNNPISARLNLRKPISDPTIDTQVKGKLNLAELAQAFPMDGLEELKGIITSDVEAKTSLSTIERQAYQDVNMSGQMKVEGITYKAKDVPPVEVKSMELQFNPRNVSLSNLEANAGKSDFKANGTIDNILAYFSPEKTMTGKLQVRSNLIDADEWMALAQQPTNTVPAAEQSDSITHVSVTEQEVFDRFDFTLDAEAGQILYDVYDIQNAVAKGQLTPNRMEVQALGAKIGDSDITASGVITNIFGYIFDGEVLAGDVEIKSQLLNLNQFMTEGSPESASTEKTDQPAAAATQAIQVPKNMDLKVEADVNKVMYTTMDLDQVRGALLVKDQMVVLEDVRAKTLGGDIAMSGRYETVDPENPGFNIKYDLQNMDFQRTFNALNTFQTLAPMAEYLQGNFSTSLLMDGKLGADLMPNLNSINAQGFLETFNSMIKNLKPLQSIGNQFNINELKEEVFVANSKNWFEIKDGKVNLQPFKYQISGIDMDIVGAYSLNQSIDFDIKAKVPTKLLEQNAVGAAASKGFDALSKEASKLGFNIQKGEFVNVGIDLLGSFKDPQLKFNVLGTDGEGSVAGAAGDALKDELDKQTDKLKEEANQKLEETKAVAEEEANKLIDSVQNKAQEEVAKATDKLKEEAEKAAQEQGEKLGTAVKDELNKALENTGKETTDKIKNELDKFNPFKKKKKKKDGGDK